jgi:hypothetical protein
MTDTVCVVVRFVGQIIYNDSKGQWQNKYSERSQECGGKRDLVISRTELVLLLRIFLRSSKRHRFCEIDNLFHGGTFVSQSDRYARFRRMSVHQTNKLLRWYRLRHFWTL